MPKWRHRGEDQWRKRAFSLGDPKWNLCAQKGLKRSL
jgi:hypothetical protein